MLHWKDYGQMMDDDLGRHDVAEYHFASAAGLPDEPTEAQKAESIDRLNHYARCADHFIQRKMPEFHQHPGAYEYCEGLFRVVCMIKVLQTQFGIRYNPAKKAENAPFTTADTFIHGALLGDGGTCSSLPVLYAAVARRLGYPLKLVQAKRHLFCRWDSGELHRFNIEVNDSGVNVHADDYYRHGRYALPPELEQQTVYLKSLTPRQELGCFLNERGYRWLDLGQHKQALESFAWCGMLTPGDKLKESHVAEVISLWRKSIWERTPPNFPKLQVKMPTARRWPGIPAQLEHEALLLEAWDMLLNRPQFDANVASRLPSWPAMRSARVPTSIAVTMHH